MQLRFITNRISYLSVLGIVCLSLFLSCTKQPTKPKNNIPEIVSITANPDEIGPNEQTTLTVLATDADGDNLTYTWDASTGTLANTTGRSVTWSAPGVTGQSTITVVVSDGRESVSSSLILNVVKYYGTLVVESTPGNATIYIDNNNTGKTTSSTFNGLELGDHVVRVKKDGYLCQPDSIIANIKKNQTFTATFTLSQTASVSGYVYYASTTVPVSGVSVSIDDVSYTTADNGYYILVGVKAGSRKLEAVKENFDNYSRNIEINEGEAKTYHIEMTSGYNTHTLSGVILNTIGQPLPGAKVTILNPDNSSSNLWDTADAFGKYQVPTVPQGTRRIRFEADDYTSKTEEIFISNTSKVFDQILNSAEIVAPTGIGETNDWNNINLSWTNANATTLEGVNVYYSSGSDDLSDFRKLNISPVTGGSYTHKLDTLTVPNTYYFRLKSVNIDGMEGDFSAAVAYHIPNQIAADAYWEETINIVDDMQFDSKLTIEQGSHINLNGGSLELNDDIDFQGINGAEIKFNSSHRAIETVVVRKGSMVYSDFSGNINIEISGKEVDITDCRFEMENRLVLVAADCNFSNCVFRGIDAISISKEDFYDVVIVNSLIHNIRGIEFSYGNRTPQLSLDNNIINNNTFGIYQYGVCTVNLTNNIITNNQVYGVRMGWEGIFNNIIIYNGKGIHADLVDGRYYLKSDYNDVWNNTSDYYKTSNLQPSAKGANDISVDPLFVSPDYENPLNGNWNLRTGSLCIGAGKDGVNIGLSDPDNIGPR